MTEGGTVWDDFDWHMIALTYDGTTAKLYVDGVEDSIAGKTWNITATNGFVGAGSPTAGELWDGIIDEAAIFGSELSAQRIEEIYNVGSSKRRQ